MAGTVVCRNQAGTRRSPLASDDVAGLCYLAAVLVRRGSARARYALWLIASARFALPSALLYLLASQAGISITSWIPQERELERMSPAIAQVALPVVRLAVGPALH
jgi:hypothetical protein